MTLKYNTVQKLLVYTQIFRKRGKFALNILIALQLIIEIN